MRVVSSEVRLRSSHVSEVHSETTGSLRAWVGERPRDDDPSARVQLSVEALGATGPGAALIGAARSGPLASAALTSAPAALMAEPPSGVPVSAIPSSVTGATQDVDAASDAGCPADTQLTILQYFVERLTGRRMRFVSGDALASEGSTAATQSSATGRRRGDAPASGGVELDYARSYREFEHMQFAAEGEVRTADGKTIRFELALSQTRFYEEHTTLQLRAGNAVRKDPLVLNFEGTAAQLLDARFEFDLDADGNKDRIPMLAEGNGYLALDISGNGRIDSGAELFGARSGDGFADLAKYDEDHNQVIDENDSVFARLRIWTPDGRGGGTLETLKERDVGALLLSRVATPFELRSGSSELGATRSTGAYLTEDGRAGFMQQLDLVV